RWGGSLSASAGRPAPTSLDGPLSPAVSAPRADQGRSRSPRRSATIASHPSKPPTIGHALPSPSSDVAGLPSGLSAGSAVQGQKRSWRPAVTTLAQAL